jgi:hypothetical protein
VFIGTNAPCESCSPPSSSRGRAGLPSCASFSASDNLLVPNFTGLGDGVETEKLLLADVATYRLRTRRRPIGGVMNAAVRHPRPRGSPHTGLPPAAGARIWRRCGVPCPCRQVSRRACKWSRAPGPRRHPRTCGTPAPRPRASRPRSASRGTTSTCCIRSGQARSSTGDRSE